MNDWFEIKQIDPSTYAICEHGHWEKMNSYLLIGSEKALLIDSGLGIGNIKKVVDELANLPVIVASTHVHWDHIGGHALFETHYVHEKEEKWLTNGIPLPLEVVREQVVKEPFSIEPPKTFDIQQYKVFKGMPTKVLVDNDPIDIGNRIIKVLHTPGHSPGHLCFYDERARYLFSGDLIYEGLIFANYPTTDPAQLRNSVLRINQIGNIEKILPAHNQVDIPVKIISELVELLNEVEAAGNLKHGAGKFCSKNISVLF